MRQFFQIFVATDTKIEKFRGVVALLGGKPAKGFEPISALGSATPLEFPVAFVTLRNPLRVCLLERSSKSLPQRGFLPLHSSRLTLPTGHVRARATGMEMCQSPSPSCSSYALTLRPERLPNQVGYQILFTKRTATHHPKKSKIASVMNVTIFRRDGMSPEANF